MPGSCSKRTATRPWPRPRKRLRPLNSKAIGSRLQLGGKSKPPSSRCAGRTQAERRRPERLPANFHFSNLANRSRRRGLIEHLAHLGCQISAAIGLAEEMRHLHGGSHLAGHGGVCISRGVEDLESGTAPAQLL